MFHLFNFTRTSTLVNSKIEIDFKPKPKVFSEEQVRSLISNIWSEFAELPREGQSMIALKEIIRTEVEENPRYPIQIFKK